MSLSQALASLKVVARELDTSLPVLLHKVDSKQLNVTSDEFPYGSWSKLQELKKEITSLKEKCNQEFTTVKARATSFSELNKCAANSLNILQPQMNCIEAALLEKGFFISKSFDLPDASEHGEAIKPLENELRNIENVKTNTVEKSLVRNEIAKPNHFDGMENSTEVNQIRSPQLPSIFVDAKQPCHSLQSPARPDLSGSKVIEEAQSSYFDPVTTPGGKGNRSCYTAMQAMTSSSLFPCISTPKTPELDTDASGKTRKVSVPVETPPDEKLVMHSRKSLLTSCKSEEPPDMTLFELRSVKTTKLPETSNVASPDTPDWNHCGLMKINALQRLQHRLECNDDSIHSPAEPDVRITASKEGLPARRRRSFWIEEEAYNSLPASLKRLFSLEQANSALHSIKLHAAETSKSRLTDEDMREATSLGGKTQSCMLLLTTLGAIWKVPGTNLYEINE